MATVVARPNISANPSIDSPGRRYDRLFFSGMALIILGTVFAGFARPYYLAGVFNAPLPSLIIHFHGRHFPAGYCYSSRKPRWSPPVA